MSDWDDAVARLSEEDWREIESLSARIQAHQGRWGHFGGGHEIKPEVIQMPYAQPDPLVNDFVALWDKLNLVIAFDWPSWDEGREWRADPGTANYDKLDSETALKLLTVLIRSDRFIEGTLMEAFESQQIPRLIDRFVTLRRP